MCITRRTYVQYEYALKNCIFLLRSMDSDSESEDGDGLGVEPEGGWVHMAAAAMVHYGNTIPAHAFKDRHDLRSVVFHSTLLYIHG